MKIRGFNDGGTFVLTFDGADQTFIDKLISSFKPELLDPVEAEPIIMEQNEVPEPRKREVPSKDDVASPNNRVFEKGPLKGKTVIQALSEEKDKAFRILSFYVASGRLPKDMHKYCATCLNNYVNYRFESFAGQNCTDLFKYVEENYTEDGRIEFIQLFSPLITSEMWNALKTSPIEPTKMNEKQQKMLIALIILRGAKLSQKTSANAK